MTGPAASDKGPQPRNRTGPKQLTTSSTAGRVVHHHDSTGLAVAVTATTPTRSHRRRKTCTEQRSRAVSTARCLRHRGLSWLLVSQSVVGGVGECMAVELFLLCCGPGWVSRGRCGRGHKGPSGLTYSWYTWANSARTPPPVRAQRGRTSSHSLARW